MAYKSNSNKFWTGFLAVLLVLVIAGTAGVGRRAFDGLRIGINSKPTMSRRNSMLTMNRKKRQITAAQLSVKASAAG